MFLKEGIQFKDGEEHHYWSLVENQRVDRGRKVVQRHVLYLGEINSSQQGAWRKTICLPILAQKMPDLTELGNLFVDVLQIHQP